MTAPLDAIALLCNPYHRGGITRWMTELAIAWRDTGAEVWFVAPEPSPPFSGAGGRPTVLELLGAYAVNRQPNVVAPRVDRSFEFGTQQYRAQVYAKALRDGVPAGIPVVTSDDPAAWVAATDIAFRNPLIGVLHSDGDNYYSLGAKHAAAAGALVCVSRRIDKRLRYLLGSTQAPVYAIPCGTFLPKQPRPPYTGACLRLAWVGRMDEEQKRVSDLPKIAAALRDIGVRFSLGIVGDGPSRAAVEVAIRSLGLEQIIRMHGWLSPQSVGNLLHNSDVLLLPSNYEGMPMVAMEALGHGCAVVASRVSGVEDYETHPLADRCLLVYEIGDVNCAARHVQRLGAQESSSRTAAALELAAEEFAIEVCVRRYAHVVAQAVATPRAYTPQRHSAVLTQLASLAVSAQRRLRLWLGKKLNQLTTD